MRVLGIETSCDETAASVVEDGRLLLSNVVASSMDLHVQYGGVVPEIAARSHIEAIIPVVQQALDEAFPTLASKDAGKRDEQWQQIDAIAVTYGAGLGGSLLIGVLTARSLAIAYGKPLYGINHVEGHLYANFLVEKADSPALAPYKLPAAQPVFPVLGLIVSGGHSQLVYFEDHFTYQLLGQTQDDAIGEAFDKVAKILGLPYPGGPSVSKKALEGDPMAFQLPKARMAGKYDFSFSGLKTAVLRLAQEQVGADFTMHSSALPSLLSEQQKADIAASFQRIAVETVVDKAVMAFEEFRPASVIIGGGVASSPELRRQLSERLESRLPSPIEYTDPKLCTDNGAMIATLGCYKAMLAAEPDDPYTLDIKPNLSM
jgi:N6-L-threonylcarbamoyladenine synthase